MDLNVKRKTIKLLEDNSGGGNLVDLGFGDIFFFFEQQRMI